MFKKIFLFVTTILVATSASTGYGSPDSLKGSVSADIFLDWFNNAEKCVHIKGLIILNLIPGIFLIIQSVLFLKDQNKLKGIFAVFAVFANLIGVFIVINYAYPIASQIEGWSPDKLPANWISLKDDWFKYIGIYGLLGILGWLCFVITYFVPSNKHVALKKLPRFINFSKNALLFFLTFVMGLSAARLYDFCFFTFTYEISGTTFIEMHRPLDLVIRKVGPIVFTFLFSLYLLLTILFFSEKSKNKGWLIILAAIFLVCDTFIALKYNGPINDLFNSWTSTTIPINWVSIRDKWLNYHLYRDVLMIFGFSSILLTYFVQKKEIVKK